MDCFGFCGEKCSQKKKKAKEKYKEEVDKETNGVTVLPQKDTQFSESAGDGQEMGTISETLSQVSQETGDLSPHVAPSGVGDPASLNNNVKQVSDEKSNKSSIGQNDVKETSQVTHEMKKKKPHQSKHRHCHDNQDSSDSEADSSSDSSSIESPSTDDSPVERTKTKKKSRSITINAPGGIVDFGKHNTNKIVHIPYGGQQKKKKNKNKDRSSRSHKKDVKSGDETRYHSMEDDNNCLGNFRKIHDETDAIYNLRLVLCVAESVGIIRSPSVLGTGFRVGENYIMTARHVVMDIINSVPSQLEEHKEDRVKILGYSNVHIDFDFELPEDSSFTQVQRQTLCFNFEPNIYYENEALDTAVLKLKPNNLGSGSNFPPKLIRFAKSENVPLYFVGHNNGMIKGFDKSSPRENLMEEEYKQLQQWSMQHQVGSQVKYLGYTGADNGSKVLFDCTFNKGASGSPGFIISKHDHMPYVVAMLLRGYPDWLYDDTVPQKEKINIPQKNMFEQGVRMTEICYDMRVRNPDMAENIFGPKPRH